MATAHITSKLAAESRCVHSCPPASSASPSASLMSSFAINGQSSSVASCDARVDFPDPGGPFTTTNRMVAVNQTLHPCGLDATRTLPQADGAAR